VSYSSRTSWIALAGKDYDNAIAELQQANLNDARNLHWLGSAYGGKGDTTKAREFFAKAAGFNSLPSIYYSFIRTKAQKRAQDKKSS
jgi:tetratricopeptide (TPR) repeat protein